MRTCSRLGVAIVVLFASGCSASDTASIGSAPDAGVSNGGPSGGGAADGAAPGAPGPSPGGQDAGLGSDGGAHSPGSEAGSDGAAPPPPSGGGGVIPSPTGTCPTIANGDVTFAPAGIAPRKVALSMGSGAGKATALVFYWHGTGSSPQEAAYSLGATLNAIVAAGGVVAAPYHDTNAGTYPWYLVTGSKTDDLLVADEVLACLAKSVGVDAAHIHSMGMSAGGLHTTAMSFLRSSYLASVTVYSGGLPPGASPTSQNPANKFAAFIFDGGSSDNVQGFDFQAASQLYQTTLKGAGHFAAICNHGKGHMVPTDAAPSVWAFFQANGFGVSPSPYAGGLPAGFPSYCSL